MMTRTDWALTWPNEKVPHAKCVVSNMQVWTNGQVPHVNCQAYQNMLHGTVFGEPRSSMCHCVGGGELTGTVAVVSWMKGSSGPEIETGATQRKQCKSMMNARDRVGGAVEEVDAQ
ncbi:hypothetical protein SUGI_0179860 [Cryptomeria japonica]|nr:hypothetical protein SUGI_0179860 [Cryptomeria japonica]